MVHTHWDQPSARRAILPSGGYWEAAIVGRDGNEEAIFLHNGFSLQKLLSMNRGTSSPKVSGVQLVI